MASFDTVQFRQVLGQYPTGVIVVTAYNAIGDVVGMTLGTFTSVSLDPPLVAFLPSVTSNSWRSLRDAGTSYGINILGNDQESVCRAVAMKKEQKFADIETYRSAQGNPVIAGSVAFIDCSVVEIHEAGDHDIVVCEVQDLHIIDGTDPLLFLRGGYGSFASRSLMAWGPGLIEQLADVDFARPFMEELAATFDTEVAATCLAGDELIVLSSTGRVEAKSAPSRVGARFPFIAPLGALYAAWGDAVLRERWIDSLPAATLQEHASLQASLGEIRERGFTISLGHEVNNRLFELSIQLSKGVSDVTQEELWRLLHAAQPSYNPPGLFGEDPIEFRLATAPVFNSTGQVAYMLVLWGPPGKLPSSEVRSRIHALTKAAKLTTDALTASEVLA